ncbi:putative quinol monooxygenase [Granulosicoccus antarcticus]|uniref:Putative quinol monooxygenase YgiN n=1 Tax=Granulosicoccus antarcticus IMCC3135 TaxID=1192854 RepID=A0A2Z2NIB2_9GAMM|nr:putative quinol monooxygenase [Granulosicoccus antarcticus]ASJ70879.1 putative quinol monooxygenase YgiN [Granulosicoccus antarcticus IMCC3135]
MIHVVAIITTEAGKRAEVLEAFAKIVPLVHAESGCIEYQPVTDADGAGSNQTPLGPDTFIVAEKWASMDELKAHSASDHMAEYARTVKGLIAGRKVHILN